MALIRKIDKVNQSGGSAKAHKEVRCEYLIGDDPSGKRFLQISTYASDQAQTDGKKQILRFSPEAVVALREILKGL